MNIVDLSIKRPVMILMGGVALILFGVMAYFQISLLPDTTMPYITIQTVYPGQAPRVENQITIKIENQISAVSGLDTAKTERTRTILRDKKRNIRNKNAILLQVIKIPSANTIEVVDNVMVAIPNIEALSGNRVHGRPGRPMCGVRLSTP
jgi:multidrug efflux pump subunit AcrB